MTQLNGLRSILERNGTVFRRDSDRKGSYRLRYRDAELTGRHRAVTLPSPDVAKAVRELIRQWQRERRRAKEQAVRAQRQSRFEARQLRDDLRLYQHLAGGGNRRRRRVAREFGASRGTVAGELTFHFWFNRANSRPGRPRRFPLSLPVI